MSIPSERLSRIRRWYRFSALRLLVAEVRNCGPRMGWVLRMRRERLQRGDQEAARLVRDSLFLAVGCYTPVYTQYMQDIRKDYPFLSVFDRTLLAKTWKAGWESCVHMGMSLSESQYRSLSPLVVSEGVLTRSCDVLRDQLSQVPDAGANASGH